MIFWKYIKGLSANGQNNVYNYIRFNAAGMTPAIANLPEVYLNTANDYDSAEFCGNILTTLMEGGYIVNEFEFRNKLKVKNDFTLEKTISDNTYSLLFSYASNEWQISSSQDVEIIVPNFKVTSTQDIVINKGLRTNKIVVTSSDDTHNGSIDAVYFNATSDYRAKKDFKPLEINAIELVKKIPLYSFKYKESNLPSIGIIAQTVEDVNIEGFKLVDNEGATGDNMDYMSIHESKLVYILWKAVQEQQKEIEELKAQIKG